MKLSRTNIVLAVLLVVIVAMTGLSSVDYSRPNYEIALPADMGRSPAYHAFAPNVNFANGRTLQLPVQGTVARGETRLYFEATPEDAIRAGEEIQNPYHLAASGVKTTSDQPADAVENGATDQSSVATENGAANGQPTVPGDESGATEESTENEVDEQATREAEARERLVASVQRGGDVYRVFCITCHGPSGAGDGLVPQRGFPPPPSMTTGKSMQMKDGQLFHIITYGQGSMSSYAVQLSPDRRWDVINYVRGMQQKAGASAAPATADAAAPSVNPLDEDVETQPNSDEEPENATTQPEAQEPGR